MKPGLPLLLAGLALGGCLGRGGDAAPAPAAETRAEPLALDETLPSNPPAPEHVGRLGRQVFEGKGGLAFAGQAAPEELEAEDKELAKPMPKRKRRSSGGDDDLADLLGAAGPAKALPQPVTTTGEPKPDDTWRQEEPARFLPRVGYFENTYLGGNAAYLERLRRLDAAFEDGRRPWAEAGIDPQPFDAPADAGVALFAHLDRRYLDQPGRVYLQVGLQGSRRYGWRRPPLDVVLVVDGSVLAPDATLAEDSIMALLRRLGPQDRLGIVLAAPAPSTLVPPSPVRDLRRLLAGRLEQLTPLQPPGPGRLGEAMALAGRLLDEAARHEARVPGTQIVLTLAEGGEPTQVTEAASAAHALSVQGAVTSNLVAGDAGSFWSVASAGHGNYHAVSASADDMDRAVSAELEAVSRVVARLLRVNVRLAPGVQAVRIVGSRMLGQQEADEVKEREVATDRKLSATLGVTADRGDDDDGLQTVIPYFYGGDAHVILLELWAEQAGPVADVTLKYKDMVALNNATAQASVSLTRAPRPDTPAELAVRSNLRGFSLAEVMRGASRDVRAGDATSARRRLEELAGGPRSAADLALIDGFRQLLGDPRWNARAERLGEALEMASERQVGRLRR